MKSFIKKTSIYIIQSILTPFFIIGWIIILLIKKKRSQPRLVWGPIPIINNKYFSNALKADQQYESVTIMDGFFSSINSKEDFDLYYSDFLPVFLSKNQYLVKICKNTFLPFVIFLYAIYRFDIFHHSFEGGFLRGSILAKVEATLIKLAKGKIVIMPYGADFYRYSKLEVISFRHVLLLNYPQMAFKEKEINKRIELWTKHADVIMAGYDIDGLARWDILPFNYITIDTKLWQKKYNYSTNDGHNGPVYIMHTPNHKGVKGSEFIMKAIKELQHEGLQAELILIEKIPNTEVRRLMHEKADILAEQLIFGYGLSGVEGMVTGIPVLSNLDNEAYTRVFRRYSYLNECPILSTTPENVKTHLKILITNPQLRKQLGEAGRKYVDKYHSEKTAQYTFGAIYSKIWHKQEVNLMNLFHPITGEYTNSSPIIQHPLHENHLPQQYFDNSTTLSKHR
ncbi:glycosyltransferase [uncultured Microscilla sp.]|uniref:glycosyltransferase n=1 Tax=uncultured Microscilla sp. TaxID=432653 RepID=UPI002636CB30|nr:glycosyltransferase [uncultured Microscilla sp.]